MSTIDLSSIREFTNNILDAYASNEIGNKELLRGHIAIRRAINTNSDEPLNVFAERYLHLGQS